MYIYFSFDDEPEMSCESQLLTKEQLKYVSH